MVPIIIQANDEWIVDDTKPASPSTVTPGGLEVQVTHSPDSQDEFSQDLSENTKDTALTADIENDIISAFPTAGSGSEAGTGAGHFPAKLTTTRSTLQIDRLTVELAREIELQERDGKIHQLHYSHASYDDHQE